MKAVYGGNNRHYLYCKAAYPRLPRNKIAQKEGKEHKCDRRSSWGLSVSKLEKFVIDELKLKIEAIGDRYFPESESIPDPRLARLNQEITELTEMAVRIEAIVPILEQKIQERESILLVSESAGKEQQLELRRKLIEYAQDDAFWSLATVPEKQALFKELIDKVVCDRGVPEIAFSL